MFKGIVTSHQFPFYRVVYEDGDSEDLTSKELAAVLHITKADVADPRRFAYDWGDFNPGAVPGFVRFLDDYMGEFSMDLPAAWTGTASDEASAAEDPSGSDEDFLRMEEKQLKSLHAAFISGARARKTFSTTRTAGLKLVWFALSRRWVWPLTALEVGMYMAKLGVERNKVGALSVAKNALAIICSMNGVDRSQYNNLQATAALEAMRREHRSVTKKAAALTAGMVRAINRRYSYLRPGRPDNMQWEFAIGGAVSAAFKLMARYDNLVKLLWDPDFCDVFFTHVRYFLDGRKNLQHGCAMLDVARPEDDTPDGVYFVLVRGKRFFGTGHVLPHIDRRTGEVDRTRPMAYGDYVAFLRSALIAIGLSETEAALFAGQSARAGAASEAAAGGLHQEDIQPLAGVTTAEWLSWYNRRYLGERLRVSRALGL